MSREFEVRREVVLPATPEQVWDAVATAEGNAGWLFPNEIDPQGPATQDWDPPHRFAIRHEQGEWFNALEFTIEARDGETTLRYMHSGIFVDDWDDQYDGVSQSTDFYLHTLGQYLAHFAGRRATYVGEVPGGIAGPPSTAGPDGFSRLLRALGLPAQISTGDGVRLTLAGVDPIDGIVDYVHPHFIGVRSEDALYRFFGRNAFGSPVAMSIHAFADGADGEQLQRVWRDALHTALD